MATQELREIRKQMFEKMEQNLKKEKPEDSLFYYHSDEDRIVLSHALFWVMAQSIRGKIAKEKYFLLLREYQEEMLTAWLTESDAFPELLDDIDFHYNHVKCRKIEHLLPKLNKMLESEAASLMLL